MHTFYSLPVSFQQLTARSKLARCPLEDSVRQHIYLILMTKLGEYAYDPQFGCEIWEQDFEVVSKADTWKMQMEKRITATIRKKEKERLAPDDLRVKVSIEEPVWEDAGHKERRVRKKLTIRVSARLKATNEPLPDLEYTLFFSPFSLD